MVMPLRTEFTGNVQHVLAAGEMVEAGTLLATLNLKGVASDGYSVDEFQGALQLGSTKPQVRTLTLDRHIDGSTIQHLKVSPWRVRWHPSGHTFLPWGAHIDAQRS